MRTKSENPFYINAVRQCSFLLLAVVLLLMTTSSPARAEEERVFQYLPYGSISDDVLTMQTRLMELGYYHDEIRLTPSLFDEGTQRALDQFCEANNIASGETGASADVQRLMFAEGAKPYAAPVVKQTLSQKFFAYMGGNANMLGYPVPMYLVWLLSLVLAALILVLAIHFFVQDKPEGRKNEEEKQQVLWRSREALRNDGDTLPQSRVYAGYSQKLDVQIHYEERIQNLRCTIPPTVTIGRGNGTIPLDASDHAVSSSHCEIFLHGAVPMIRDHSSNGTYINGRYMHNAECRLNSGDCLKIGAHDLMIEF